MMRQMRENTKWIMLVTALAFVALMVFEWGMDMSGRSAGGLGEIGRVNGTPVMYEDYMGTYRSLYDQYQNQQEEPLTTQQNREIEDQAFDQVVNQILIRQELERRGVRVTDEEVRQAARFNPPPEFRNLPLFQTEGQFDLQKYQQYISSPQVDEQTLLYLESYFRDAIPRGKLLRQVTSGIFLTDGELWERWKMENETVEVDYLAFSPLERIPDDSVAPTESEILSYYEENEEDFEVPARATVRAVILPKAPLASDTAAARERAAQVADDLRAGETWDALAAAESVDQATASEGGDLGVFPRGHMVQPVDSAVFEGPVGEVLDPVESQFGVHVIEVQERWGQDSVRARHILVPIERTDNSEIQLLTLADSLEDLSENRGLEEAAAMLDLEVQTAQINEDVAFIPGGGQVGEGGDWAFLEAIPGDVSPVFENSQSFYGMELVESTPAGVMSLEDATPTIRQILTIEKKLELGRDEAGAAREQISGGATMEEVAAAAGLTVRSAGPFARTDFVEGLGRENAAVGVGFGLDDGEVSPPVQTEDNVFLIRQTGHTPADSAVWEEQKREQRARLQNQLQDRRLQQWLEGLRAEARIVDRRAEVLRPADEDEQARPMGGFGF